MARANFSLRAFNFVDWRDFRRLVEYRLDVEHLALYPPAAGISFSRRARRNSHRLSRLHSQIRAFCRILRAGFFRRARFFRFFKQISAKILVRLRDASNRGCRDG